VKLPYREGTWFAVPLREGGFAVGVVARATTKGKVILCYFFGPHRTAVPSLSDLERLKPSDAIRVLRVGDLSLICGEWPIIGQTTSWKRSDWPMPPFIRRSELSGRAWRVQYSDADPNAMDREEPESYNTKLEEDSVFGSGAVELVLTKVLM
jgi:hypothetical protein